MARCNVLSVQSAIHFPDISLKQLMLPVYFSYSLQFCMSKASMISRKAIRKCPGSLRVSLEEGLRKAKPQGRFSILERYPPLRLTHILNFNEAT
jgi:hypothetical protein